MSIKPTLHCDWSNLLDDVLLLDVGHAHLAGHVHVARLGHVETRRTQTVAVEDRTNVPAVGERKQSCSQWKLSGSENAKTAAANRN